MGRYNGWTLPLRAPVTKLETDRTRIDHRVKAKKDASTFPLLRSLRRRRDGRPSPPLSLSCAQIFLPWPSCSDFCETFSSDRIESNGARSGSYCSKTGRARRGWPSTTSPSRNLRSTRSNTRSGLFCPSSLVFLMCSYFYFVRTLNIFVDR